MAVVLTLSQSGRRYGYIKDKPDHRDFGVAQIQAILQVPPTGRVSNAAYMGPVLDQGQQGSCTAHAGSADREFLHWKQIAALGKPVTPGSSGLYSPAFLYYIERLIDGTLSQGDYGSSGRTSCQALRECGCALRVNMPYSDGDYSTVPTPMQLAAARAWPTGQYHRLGTVDDMKSVIASGYNFRIGFAVLESFESNIGSSGIWTPDGNVIGYHETLVYGYDDDVNGGSFLVRNSWGYGFGKNGDFYLRYQDAADPNILQDAWIQHLGIWSKPAAA